MTSKELLEKIVSILDEKKAEDIVAIETAGVTIVADYFVIASATSNPHVKSLADDVEDELAKLGVFASHIEGRATGWILLDFNDVIVHIFLNESREYYNLERLWADAKQVDISALITE
ncbi:MAG: ribosome silencing factor [Clostridia bacterium]|nr:ribosome silencing factor [Clostridia bacterium]